MPLTRLALGNPVATLVAVMLTVLFGAISLYRLPIQLTPEVEEPEITISTRWRAAAPEEVEKEIIEPQEKALRGLPGMLKMLSEAKRGEGVVTITFSVGFNLQRGLIEVLNRLNRVPRYPEDADEPTLSTVGGSSRPVAWFILETLPGNERDIASYQDYIEEVVQTRFERIPGVAKSEVRGGREHEVRITIDPYRAASLGVELPEATRLIGGNDNVSGGTADVGKRRYTIRFPGAFDADKFGGMVLEWRDGRPILLRDIADIDIELVDRKGFVSTDKGPSMAVNAHRETGVNVLDVMEELAAASKELREGPLQRARLSIRQVYDETLYIHRAIAMLHNNLGMGVLLAVAVLWWFLRRFRATLVVALSIPLSLTVTFAVMYATGRTLNVVSLAGLAFSVGMVLDASIVVLENIVRLRQKGVAPQQAALEGTTQVWGALLASTLTTVAIFLPVVFLRDEAGQLFADLALAIAVAVSASLVIALTVVPVAAHQWLENLNLTDPHQRWWDHLTTVIMRLTDTPARRTGWIAGLIAVTLTLTLALSPKADYLPEGNRNLVFAFILPPPGANIDQIEHEMGRVIAARMEPYLDGQKEPQVERYFFVVVSRGVFMGAIARDESRVGELVPVINEIIGGFPDTIAIAKRASLFGGFGEGRTVEVNIQGRDVEALLKAALAGYVGITRAMPTAAIRPLPSLELAEPELRLLPDEQRIAAAGWNRGIIGNMVRVLGEGLYVGDYFDGEQRLDIIVRIAPWESPEALGAVPLATPRAGILPVNELLDIRRTAGPDQIRRLDRRRTITLQVTPPAGMSLEDTLSRIRQEVAPGVEALLPEDGEIRYTGTADKLGTALRSMGGSFLLAIAILYLLMSALFRSFVDGLLVMLALPLATVGGVLALRLVGLVTFQPMDLLTMIGFIILLGLVVNNAILLVYQTRASERDGLARRDAVAQAVHLRLRPILMSTLTSIFGMLPLLLVPGAGSELYRGLAAVIVGGMSVSTLFTLLLLPSLLRVGEGAREDGAREPGPSQATP